MVGEADAPLRECVERRRVDVGIAVAPQIPPAEIVGEDEEDVGPARRSRFAVGPVGGREHAEQGDEKNECPGFHACIAFESAAWLVLAAATGS